MHLPQTLPPSGRVHSTSVLLIDEPRGKVLRHARRTLHDGPGVEPSPRRSVRVPLGGPVVEVDLFLEFQRERRRSLHTAIPRRSDYLLRHGVFARRRQEYGQVVRLVQAMRGELGMRLAHQPNGRHCCAVLCPPLVAFTLHTCRSQALLPNPRHTATALAPHRGCRNASGHLQDGPGSSPSVPSAIRPAANSPLLSVTHAPWQTYRKPWRHT